DELVDVRGDVLLVSAEDDEAVLEQLLDARDALEVVVGEEVGAVAAVPVPAEEAGVEAPELLGQTRGNDLTTDDVVGEGISEVDGVDAGVEVPAVAAEDVVGMPRVRRLDHEDAVRAERLRPEDEGRVVAAARPRQPRDVVAARPVRAE